MVSIDAVPVDASETYNFAGVYSFGRGLFARGPLSGGKTSYRVFHRLHEGQFVISEPKAWEGAIARVSSEFDGWFLSPVFPTFALRSGVAMSEFVEYFLKQPRVWNALRTGAKGLGARRESVPPAQFLSLQMRLPGRSEQEAIVSRLAKVEAAMRLHEEVGRELEALFNSALVHEFDGSGSKREKESPAGRVGGK